MHDDTLANHGTTMGVQRMTILAMAVVIACASLARASGQGLFTSAELKQLRAWSITPVAPSYVPPGYAGHVTLDKAAHKYEITYRGPAGAYFVFAGAAGSASAPSPTPAPKHHNMFSSIGSLFNHHASQSQGVAGEEEADPNQDIAADSPLIGTTHFKETKSHCATGVGQKTIGAATYSLMGCNTSPDDLVKVYRSAAAVSH
ncbi:MAG: hypothetical protein JOZ50_04760 [Candidatus Eremiobacteraeota bacterium]|nr:hypothetical protein [Candidatus Eremiobacteraeota bacterium]